MNRIACVIGPALLALPEWVMGQKSPLPVRVPDIDTIVTDSPNSDNSVQPASTEVSPNELAFSYELSFLG